MVTSDYSFFSGCSYLVTIDPVLTESNNDLILIVETPILHFAGLKFSSRLRELTNHNREYLCRQILNLEYPQKSLPKKILAKFSYPYPPPPPPKKKIGIENFKPKKSFNHPCHLKSGVPNLGLSSIMLSLYEKHKRVSHLDTSSLWPISLSM